MRVRLESRVERGDDPADGGFYAWSLADTESKDLEDEIYPFVFDVPDYGLHHALELPAMVNVQLAAFAHEAEAYPDEDAYRSAQQQKYDGPGFAAESFIPSGLFQPGGEETSHPEAFAILSGTVLRAETLVNPAGGASFHWAKVRTLGGEVDLVADPEVLVGELSEGGVISGTFWLSGRIEG